MSLPNFDLLPPFQEETNFLFSTNQRCQSSSDSHIETPPGSTFSQDTIDIERFSHTSERLCSQVLALEIALNEAVGVSTDHDRIGLCQALDAGSFIRDFTQCQLFLTPCSTHLTDHNQPRMDAQTESKLDTFRLLQTLIQVSYGIEDTQA